MRTQLTRTAARIRSAAAHEARRLRGRIRHRPITPAGALPQWMHDGVATELAPYTATGIQRTDLATAAEWFDRWVSAELVHLSVKNGRLAFQARPDDWPDYIWTRFQVTTEVVAAAARHLDELELVLYLGDGLAGEAEACPVPVFTFSKSRSRDRSALLFPDPLTLSTGPTLRREIAEGNTAHPWASKIDKAFWRGATTGGPHTLATYADNARFRLVELSRSHPELIDAAFTSFHTCDPDVEDLARRRGYMAEYVRPRDHLRYKYLPVLDGFTSPWPRLFWGLHGNSLLFRQQSDHMDWVDYGARADRHYVAIAPDLSDLVDRLHWAAEHDDAAESVSVAATELARDLSHANLLGLLRLSLTSYERLLC